MQLTKYFLPVWRPLHAAWLHHALHPGSAAETGGQREVKKEFEIISTQNLRFYFHLISNLKRYNIEGDTMEDAGLSFCCTACVQVCVAFHLR